MLKSICRYLPSPSGIFQKVGGSASNRRQNQTKLEAVHSVVILQNTSISFCRTTGSEALLSSLNPWSNTREVGWFTTTGDVCCSLPLILWKLLVQQTKKKKKEKTITNCYGLVRNKTSQFFCFFVLLLKPFFFNLLQSPENLKSTVSTVSWWVRTILSWHLGHLPDLSLMHSP